MKKQESSEIRNIWKSPQSVEPEKRNRVTKEVITGIFLETERQSEEENDAYYEKILKHRRSLLSPRTVERERKKETAIQRIHVP